jgi:uncharacterized protein (DUF433 family)
MSEDSQTAIPAVIRKTPGVIGGDACLGNRLIAVWMLVQAYEAGSLTLASLAPIYFGGGGSFNVSDLLPSRALR